MKVLYIDMDNVLVDFPSAFEVLPQATLNAYPENKDEIPGIFSLMKPMPNAVESYNFLCQHFDTYILSTAPWNNPSAWSDKLLWVQKYFPTTAYKRLILSHHKNLNDGHYLVDDRIKNGATDFKGEHIHFMSDPRFPDWPSVVDYLKEKENIK